MKKVGRTLGGKLIAHEFSQKDGGHCDGSLIHSNITHDTIIYIMLMLMLMAKWETQIIDVKGSILHKRLQDG